MFTNFVILITRFIPAYAGNSFMASVAIRNMTVHPRLRGELENGDKYKDIVSGSSPLTRGTRHVFNAGNRKYRFIPAYAGNSSAAPGDKRIRPVHPRLRGELCMREVTCDIHTGSSPLTRGTHFILVLIAVENRFIPAYAGNS